MVDADATPGGNGLAWGTAFQDLQYALTEAAVINADDDTGNDIDSIWIAEGTYKPSLRLESSLARSASFSLIDNVTLYGGFSGVEAALDDRDWFGHVVTLSGNLGSTNDWDNAYTVVYCGESVEAVLDGIVITDGNADHSYIGSHPERRSGAGIYNTGTLLVTNCTLSDNSATGGGEGQGNGGGIFNSNTLTVVNCVLSNNSASNPYNPYGNGGGICSSGALTVTDCTFSGNSAHYYGGAIYGSGTVANCIFSANSAEYGGGICTPSSSALVVTESMFFDNSGYRGGGIWNSSSGILTSRNCTLSDNSATYGGGISNSGTLTVNECSLLRNGANYGGGISNSGTLMVEKSSISENRSGNNGAGIENSGTLTIMGSLVSENQATIGGGIANSDTLTITDCTLVNNSAVRGGAFYGTGTLVVTETILLGNSAKDVGGAIYNSGTLVVTATNCTISGNSSDNDGGAIFNSYGGKLSFTNSTISYNSAYDCGGGIHSFDTVILTNCTVLGNSANLAGGIALYSSSCLVILNNTIIASNNGMSYPDIWHALGALSGSYNLIGASSGQSVLVDGVDGNQVGTIASPIDPMLSEWGVPLPGSPAINAGSNVLAVDTEGESLLVDRKGRQRVLYEIVDIGAYEFGLPGDASQDYQVDDADAQILAAHWLMREGARWELGDFNGDGRVDDLDASIMAAHWGTVVEFRGSNAGDTTGPKDAGEEADPWAEFGRIGPRRMTGPVLAPPRTMLLQSVVAGQRKAERVGLALPVEEQAALVAEEEALASSADPSDALPDPLAWAWEMTQAQVRRHTMTKINAPARAVDYLLARHAFDRWT
ncbi:MAG: hypothetical protein JW818_22380 [Pirellulales bacterium]|nr:hypothetical protein [Pirellulales bacterium]